MKLLQAFCLITFFFSGYLWADTWPLSNVVYNSLYSAHSSQFVYVPEGVKFTKIKLKGKVIAGGSNNVLSVYLDGHIQDIIHPRDGISFTIGLPDLSPGFHRIELVGHPTVLDSSSPKNINCPQIYSLPLGISDLFLKYIPSRFAAPQIAYLPDGLYNRSYPTHRPLLGAIDLQPATPSSFGAALRLASWFKANRPIRWEGGLHGNADFQILLVYQSNLKSLARITVQEPTGTTSNKIAQLRIPTLIITYRNDNGLQSAVMALLNKKYRRELMNPIEDITSKVAPPVWGSLFTPSTFSQLGLSNIILRGSEQQSVFLHYPPYWQPVGSPTGHIILRTQAGLANGSHINIWLGNSLAGSDVLAFIGSGSIQQKLPVNDASIPHHTNLGLRLHSVLLANRICDVPVPGTLWINASNSEITLPHRYKTGVMALLPQLTANPSVVVSYSSASLSAALNIAATEQMVTGGKPLPYIVSFTKPAGGSAALNLLVSKKAFFDLATRYTSKLNQNFLNQSVLLHAKKSGMIQVIAPNEAILSDISDVWLKALPQIPDGTLDAALNVKSGYIQVLAYNQITALPLQDKTSSHQYKIIVIVIVVLFLLTITGLLLWVRRWRRS